MSSIAKCLVKNVLDLYHPGDSFLNASKARTADRSLKTQRVQGVFRNVRWKNRGNTVRYCWWKKSGDHQLRLVVLSQILQGFIHPRRLNHPQYHSAQKQTAGIQEQKKTWRYRQLCVGMGAEKSSREIPTTWKSAMFKFFSFKSLWFNHPACTPQVRHPFWDRNRIHPFKKGQRLFGKVRTTGIKALGRFFSQACWGLEMDQMIS